MGRFREKLFRFMYGRNGMDKYNMFLFWTYFVLTMSMYIVSIFVPDIVSLILYLCLTTLAIYMIFRFMSRNLIKRQAENRKYLACINGVKSFFKLQKNKFKDRKTHIYKKCPYCKAVLRLKKIKGNHRAVCPRCSKSFDVRVK